MKVTAIKTGYAGRLIEAGQTFEVPDGATASWFVPVSEAQPEAGAAPAPSRRKKAPAAQGDALTP